MNLYKVTCPGFRPERARARSHREAYFQWRSLHGYRKARTLGKPVDYFKMDFSLVDGELGRVTVRVELLEAGTC